MALKSGKRRATGWRLLLALVPRSGMAIIFLVACRGDRQGRGVFELLSPDETGVAFANTITTSDSLNEQTDPYVYNGAGVAVGDIDNDGLPDIFFSGNMVSSRLYRNKGEMRFDDITQKAGVGTTRWATGASMVDINNDGYLDIYVSVSGQKWSKGSDRANLLFVNNGNGTFAEAAVQYAIADTSFTTHAVFLDYDRDGCLDLFLLNNSPADFSRGGSLHPAGLKAAPEGTYNTLYRNECVGGKPGRFTDVSRAAGVLANPGYGLGVVVADLNRDGWPDIYVSNDVMPNDVIYVNNRDGTFTNKAGAWLKHASYAGMGVDVADFNNDGWPDIVQADMMPRDLEHRKRMSGFSVYSQLDSRRRDVHVDYSENSLQLSNGVTRDGDVVFSEIGRLAGTSHTDWSWSALFADFDNDGNKDVFIGNGYPKAVNDLDYMAAMNAARLRGDKQGMRRLLTDLPGYRVSNFLFRNNGDLTFSDRSEQWGMREEGFSYGAAYADLNNDGRLDLVVNNIDAPASIYENVIPSDDAHHYIVVSLVGDAPHQISGVIGATVVVSAGGKKQYVYCTPYRGFMSSVDMRAHFGLGNAQRIDSLEVEWPDGRHQLLTNVAVDQTLTIKQADASPVSPAPEALPVSPAPGATPLASSLVAPRWFEPVDLRGLRYAPLEAQTMDYSIQPLLPYSISRHGPALAVGDVNGDRLDDLFIGGGSGAPARLFVQQPDASFREAGSQPWDADKGYDDWGASFIDANGDGRQDLYVARGGYTLTPGSALLQDRLYLNQGDGRYVRAAEALPAMLTSTGVVRAGDFNGDGRPDLFVGGRLTPRKYPYPTRSYVLRNDGGHFTDVTNAVAPELVQPGGMITDAAWVDFDGDGHLDLVTVGEWMPIQFFRNDGQRFRDVTRATGLPSTRGWWYSLAVGDFDRDGRPDLVAGNLGLNSAYTTSKDTTFGVYATNFTGNRTTDVILTQKIGGQDYPLAGLSALGTAIYPLTILFPTHGSFATATLGRAFGDSSLRKALHYEVDTFASTYLHNAGGGKFDAHRLPNLAQISPIRAMATTDVDGDGNPDLIVAGNLYDTEVNNAPVDAGNGGMLRGDGKGGFVPIPPVQSGFLAAGEVTGLAIVQTRLGATVIVANVADSLQTFRIRREQKKAPVQ